MAASPESFLPINEPSETPAWVRRVVGLVAWCVRRPQKFFVAGLHAAGCIYVGFATVDTVQAAGLAHTRVCAFRAGLFYELTLLMFFVDFCAMLSTIGSPGLPNVLSGPSKPMLSLAHKRLREIPVNLVVAFLFQVGPVMVWFRRGLAEFSGAIVAIVIVSALHNAVNELSFAFWATFNDAEQKRFTEQLVKGELTYDAAADGYRAINAARRSLAKGLQWGGTPYLILMMLVQAVTLYDYELRPWSSPALLVAFVLVAVTFVFFMSPWIGLHDWPDELVTAMMDAQQLAWTPSERTNFAALVGATKVKICLLDFEMTSGFRTALPLVFFGWWLYMTELRQFHGFQGFSFDFPQCYNATPSHEHHEL